MTSQSIEFIGGLFDGQSRGPVADGLLMHGTEVRVSALDWQPPASSSVPTRDDGSEDLLEGEVAYTVHVVRGRLFGLPPAWRSFTASMTDERERYTEAAYLELDVRMSAFVASNEKWQEFPHSRNRRHTQSLNGCHKLWVETVVFTTDPDTVPS